MPGAIVLAGGPSRRLGRSKPFVRVGGVPMVLRVVRAVGRVAEPTVLVSRGPTANRLAKLVPGVRVVRDAGRIQTPLVGLCAGSDALRSAYVLALACDHPFLSPALLRALVARARDHGGAVPRWTNGMVEPLVAAYRRRSLLRAVSDALEAGERSNQAMLDRIEDLVYVPVAALRRVDPRLRSFVNVNTPADLARARRRGAPHTTRSPPA